MAAVRRTQTTILGGHGNRTDLSVIAAIFSSPWVFLRPANDNAIGVRWLILDELQHATRERALLAAILIRLVRTAGHVGRHRRHTGHLDVGTLRAFDRPVYYALGGRSNPDYFGLMAQRLGTIFPDFTI